MNLTAEQEEVVAIANGRHLVLAPPGSGKTEMLSQRILRALATGVDPARMLCATFTNRAAFEMRDRVANSGVEALPDVGNLHHFCHRYLMSVGLLHPGKHVLDEVEQYEFIKEVVDLLRDELRYGESSVATRRGLSVSRLIEGVENADRRKYLSELLEEHFAWCLKRNRSPYPSLLAGVLIAHQARIGIPYRYRKRIPAQLHELNTEGVLRALSIAYAKLKLRFGCVDFDDLVNETFLSLERNPLPEERKYRWVQIDEVQDLNPMQWQIVSMLTAQDAVSVYFGDFEQSIFSFLGASLDSLREATAGCVRHYFKTNFRATPLLLEVLMRYSIDVLSSDWEFLPAPAKGLECADASPGGLLTLESSCDYSISSHVDHLLSQGIADNVAVLVATNLEADHYETLLKPLGHRMVKVSGYDLFSYSPMRDFLAFVSLFNKTTSMQGWSLLFHRFAMPKRSRADARYLVREMFACGYDPLTILGSKSEGLPSRAGSSRRVLFAIRYFRELRSLRNVLRPVFRNAERQSFRSLFAAFASIAFDESRRYSVRELLAGIDLGGHDEAGPELFSEGVKFAQERIERFLRYTDHVYGKDTRTFTEILEEDWLVIGKLKEADLLVGDEKIVISTIHKAKGRQFDAVVIPDVRRLLLDGSVDEECEAQRLLYVAMSRAKRHLSLFNAERDRPEIDCIEKCFQSDYQSYYLRKHAVRESSVEMQRSEFADDWLWHWERLAAANASGEFDCAVVEEALKSDRVPVSRMAVKCYRHIQDQIARRQKLLEVVRSSPAVRYRGCRNLAVDIMRQCEYFDNETISLVRATVLQDDSLTSARSALEFLLMAGRSFRARVSPDELTVFPHRTDSKNAGLSLVLNSLGDFLYSCHADLRCLAAAALDELSESNWSDVISGSVRDFDYLATVADPSHEESIRKRLQFKLPSSYARRLRNILKSRAFLQVHPSHSKVILL